MSWEFAEEHPYVTAAIIVVPIALVLLIIVSAFGGADEAHQTCADIWGVPTDSSFGPFLRCVDNWKAMHG